MWPLILGVVLVLLAIAYKRATRYYGTLESLGVPVVKPWLCFGSVPVNYHEFKFHDLDMKWFKDFGKPKCWGFYDGHVPTLAVVDPAMLKSILVKQFDSFRERLTPSLHIPNKFLSLDAAGGEKWKTLRKFLSSTFTAGRLKGMVQPIEHQVDQLLIHIRGRLDGSESAIINMKDIYQSLTIDIIAKVAFGIEVNSVQPSGLNKSSKFYSSVVETFGSYTMSDRWTSYFFLVFFNMFPGALPASVILPGKQMDYINSSTKSVIQKRDELNMADQGDFIDRLRMMIHKIRDSGKGTLDGLDEEMVVAQGIVFLAAGYETTASTLGTLTYNLAKHPEIQQRCVEEIEDVISNKKEINHETISELHYLEACIKENLRLFPPAFRNQRYCNRDTEVEGILIKKGTAIVIPIYVMHMDPDIYGENVEEFDPERFLNDATKEQIDNHQFHAFGGGPRICIGMRFAMEEMKIALAKLLTNFEIIDEPMVTELNFSNGNPFLLSYNEMNVKIRERKE